MAEYASDYTRGDMEVKAHEATFGAFILMTKWGSLAIASLLLFLVLWFCTGAGFIGAAATAVVVAVLGTLVLRDKAPAAAH